MQHVSKRFRKFSTKLAGRMSADTFDKLTYMGVWKLHRAGRRGCCWVTGYLYRHGFEALLYPRHAIRPEIELQRSRIRKLYLRQTVDDRIVASFNRGWELPPCTKLAQETVDYLASVLAFFVYGPIGRGNGTTG